MTEWFGTATDITDRKLGEETLRKTEKLAVVGRLAATISHEINNPLEAITNLLYLIKTEGEREVADLGELRGYVQTAQQELSRVSHVVTNTLQFNRQSTAATHERLSSLMESALGIYEGRLRVSEIRLLKRYDKQDAVLCYASELRQVFTNLIGNAFDATKKGGALALRTRRRPHWSTGKQGVSVLIRDTGVGMSAETLKHLFEPFFTTKGIHGTGLGLWVSRSILDKHHASSRIRSSQDPGNSGTCWYLWFPEHAAL